MEPLSEGDAAEQATRAQQIIAITSHFLSGQEPGVVGSVLADLMAMYLVSHQIPTDPMNEHDMRTTLLAHWCETVWKLVAINERGDATKQ